MTQKINGPPRYMHTCEEPDVQLDSPTTIAFEQQVKNSKCIDVTLRITERRALLLSQAFPEIRVRGYYRFQSAFWLHCTGKFVVPRNCGSHCCTAATQPTSNRKSCKRCNYGMNEKIALRKRSACGPRHLQLGKTGLASARSPSPETHRQPRNASSARKRIVTELQSTQASPEAAWMILTNVGFKDAPPTRKPSISGHAMSSTQLSGVTDPPY